MTEEHDRRANLSDMRMRVCAISPHVAKDPGGHDAMPRNTESWFRSDDFAF